MKSLSHFFVWIVAFGLLTLGCERHSFEETSILHEEHGAHGEEHAEHGHGEHGDKAHEEHTEKGDHGHDEDHAPKEDHAHDGDEKTEEKGKTAPKKEEARDTGI